MTIPTIGIIGAGHMGSALFRVLSQTFPGRVYITDRHKEKLAALPPGHKLANVASLLARCHIIILAIKPQSFKEFSAALAKNKLRDKLVISILAAVPLKRLAMGTGATKVVRSMPNLPAQVGSGVTEWVASRAVSKTEKQLVKKIFGATGLELEVTKESLIGKLSTISGSGPAFFFYLTELLAAQAESFGLTKREANRIAVATLVGAGALIAKSTQTPAEWRLAVTSKAGITEAALKYLNQNQFDKIFFAAINAAKKRSEELAEQL